MSYGGNRRDGFPAGKVGGAGIVVAIPVYRAELSENEAFSFRRNTAVLGGKYPIVLFAPEGMDLAVYRGIFPEFEVESFPARFFRSIGDYSRLLLSEEFYERFSRFEWLLICQLDALALSDELEVWCSTPYDFIGAPIPARWEFYMDGSASDTVCNGGFSLRRISAFQKVLRAGDAPMYTRDSLKYFFRRHCRRGNFLRALIPLARLIGIANRRGSCLERLRRDGIFEDMVFRALSQPGLEPRLAVPPLNEAARFALDGGFLWKYHELSGRTTPVAVHAWHQPEGMEFLRSIRRLES